MQKTVIASATLLSTLLAAPLAAADLTLYSGRGESMVDPIIAQFERNTGINVNVRYGDTAQLAVLLQEEGERSPADLYWGQDAGAMGAISQAGLLAELPDDIYEGLPSIYTSETGNWVAASGRARVFAYSPERVSEDEYPDSVFDLTDERYEGRVGWAPTNGSFQSFITAMRVEHGDERTLEWLEDMRDNGAVTFRNNTTQVQGIADGEIDFGLVNNYYLPRFLATDEDFPVEQAFFAEGDIGNLVNVAGIAVLESSDNKEEAMEFVRFLLSPAAQQYFTGNVYEYPVTRDVIQNPELEDFDRLLEVSPQIDLDELEDLEGTLNLLRDAELL
ncbi:iron(III) transport system substrate-binding protein [Franzmannia pantelleriensis]|uniref:Iron(III) transport system substrate-binding protein n=1 Tax=Franzmannia pantelleriensis TaxID=48727 RepID=A0A1G9SU37_9GAMM|nr:iron ABC transporter substrate-binding protein [Halomonas pantelleriensis]SDM38854.1 iron(III) transport system substrate-binding protein [Halomonas pantelleriensis]